MQKTQTVFEESKDYVVLDEFQTTKDGKKRRLAECNYCHKKHPAFSIMSHVYASHGHRSVA